MRNWKLSSISKGCRLNDRIFCETIRLVRKVKLKTEKDVARFIDLQIKKAGARNAFPTIVAIGKNAVDWHHRPTDAKLACRGFCVIDFGSRVNGYCSDMTRTIYFGKASTAEKKLYAKVLMANTMCTKKIRRGVDCHAVYLYAKKILGKHAKYFGHGLGHGLKKIIHAHPRLGKKHGHFLKEGDVITIEPGIYIPRRLGIRVEDSVLVKRNTFEVLTKSQKKLIQINSRKA